MFELLMFFVGCFTACIVCAISAGENLAYEIAVADAAISCVTPGMEDVALCEESVVETMKVVTTSQVDASAIIRAFADFISMTASQAGETVESDLIVEALADFSVSIVAKAKADAAAKARAEEEAKAKAREEARALAERREKARLERAEKARIAKEKARVEALARALKKVEAFAEAEEACVSNSQKADARTEEFNDAIHQLELELCALKEERVYARSNAFSADRVLHSVRAAKAEAEREVERLRAEGGGC